MPPTGIESCCLCWDGAPPYPPVLRGRGVSGRSGRRLRARHNRAARQWCLPRGGQRGDPGALCRDDSNRVAPSGRVSMRWGNVLDVFLTVDVEIWCDGWHRLDEKFPQAFRSYVYGPTDRGAYGLPFTLDLLNAHGLNGVFFIEPLFAGRFGTDPLAEIVGLVGQARQEIQLHLHTEWADEAVHPVVDVGRGKRQHLRHFDVDEQTLLIAEGQRLLRQAGAEGVQGFRAGSFGFNADTLRALARLGIRYDSSYNATCFGLDSGVQPGSPVFDPICCDGVWEYPMTVFRDGTGSLRHVQLTACSSSEIEGLLWQALEYEKGSFVILSHNFEMMNRARSRPDDVVVSRFRRLCTFLSRHRDSFRTCGFADLAPPGRVPVPRELSSPLWRTGVRLLEQAYRRSYR